MSVKSVTSWMGLLGRRSSHSAPLTQKVQYLGSTKIVSIDYADLVGNKDLSHSIDTAYGENGLGLVVIQNAPNVLQTRQHLLPLAREFASLPDAVKAKYEHKESFYSFGWSHGKEIFAGQPDFSKGSYYNNPIHDSPVKDAELIKKFPSFCHPNIWPQKELPQLQNAFKQAGGLIVDVGALLARHCDQFVKRQCSSYKENTLRDTILKGRTHKARLLHYFPLAKPPTDGEQLPEWCGWHNDHGSLTGLFSAMFIDANGKAVGANDPHGGLFIRTRAGEMIKAVYGADMLAYQIGETAQIQSGGLLQATPHCVRGTRVAGLSRETMAVFMEPEWDWDLKLPKERSPQQTFGGSSEKYLPSGMPSLESRWKPGYDFNEFSQATFQAYYPTQ